ncbi:uracil-DNA glycosylase [Archangium sp.]|uniref:uracil-DNA glycosylase n=1 Tax=Archangium sp. TaxID=1872627 RepID=UPI0039C878B4
MKDRLPADWKKVLKDVLASQRFAALEAYVEAERRRHTVYPSEEDLFSAFHLTPYDEVKVLLLGQDPYHGPGQAHGLAFSVQPGVKPPPSLVNLFKELQSDVGVPKPKDGSLVPWAKRGVLLLNAVLTVREGLANAHEGQGWENFTDAVIQKVSDKPERVVFLLWGSYAQKKESLIDTSRHVILKAPHPSPLSAKRGFFGSKPFSLANEALKKAGREPIDWALPS